MWLSGDGGAHISETRALREQGRLDKSDPIVLDACRPCIVIHADGKLLKEGSRVLCNVSEGASLSSRCDACRMEMLCEFVEQAQSLVCALLSEASFDSTANDASNQSPWPCQQGGSPPQSHTKDSAPPKEAT